jgi:hypothetical protein
MPVDQSSGAASRKRPAPWHRTSARSTRQATYRLRRLPSSPAGPLFRTTRPKGCHMASTKDSSRDTLDADMRISDALEAQLHALCSEDDFAGGLLVCDRYPEFETRELSLFEHNLRDWGYIYGLAFGLAMRDNPDMAHEDAARLAYMPARRVYARWSGEIENPAEQRERAIRTLVRRFNEAEEVSDNGRMAMTADLHDAILDLAQSARG